MATTGARISHLAARIALRREIRSAAACGCTVSKTSRRRKPPASSKKKHHHQGRQHAGQEHGVDRHAGDDGVHDQRHRGCQQYAQGAGAGDQTDAAPLREAGAGEQGQQESTQGQDGYAAAAGEGREEGTKHRPGNCRAQGAAPEQGGEQRSQAVGGTGTGKDDASQGKQWQRRQRRVNRDLVMAERHRSQGLAFLPEQGQGQAAQYGEDGGSAEQDQHQPECARPERKCRAIEMGGEQPTE